MPRRILVFVLRKFGSCGEARRWPLALGWAGEDDRHTKPLHWVSEPWCGVPLVDCLACVCPTTREATRRHFVAHVCPANVSASIPSSTKTSSGPSEVQEYSKGRVFFLFCFPFVCISVCVKRHLDFRIYLLHYYHYLLNYCPL